ncbi:MAG: ATP phosphoribosyltransferase regulatory subunit [Clostridia bacterium]|nr:ATP phosphoribosyltransferase regulatory subunit [Clostridia bacterium]
MFDFADRITSRLSGIYAGFGYSPYKMSKFEEYDLYARNREFLISDGVITFTDTDGRLMALKPDVTLSIIKNCDAKPGQTRKLFYSENVYRVSKGTDSFKEILQIGLECIGRVDGYCVAEVLYLAALSLKATGRGFVLDLGEQELLTGAALKISDDPAVLEELMTCVREKNVHGVDEIAARLNPAGAACAAPLKTLVGLYGTPAETLPKVAEVAAGLGLENAYFKLKSAADALEGTDCAGCVRIDFSTAGDRNYYNGIAFKGYVEGVPERVLSGGQYDRLVRRFLPDGEAIGFAVYVDSLEKLPREREEFDGDVLLIYGADAPQKDVLEAVIGLNAGGLSVKAAPSDEAEALKQRYRRTAYVDGKGDVSYEK